MTLLNDPLRSQLELQSLLDTVLAVRADVLTAEGDWAELLEQVDPVHAESARNLTHYLALRQHDLRSLQVELSRRSLSSLGRCEPHVLGSLDALVAVLEALVKSVSHTAAEFRSVPDRREPVAFVEGPARLAANADALLGKPPSRRSSRITVTMPSDAATDAGLVEGLLMAGMDVALINCAHDDPAAWRQMAQHVRDAAGRRGLTCKIAMDLAGPKLRTGELMPGPAVLRVAPVRDQRGVVVAPALVGSHR